MAMNPFLTEIYGTGTEEETEKTAESLLLEELEKVAAEEGIDLNELSDEDIVEILSEAISDEAPVASEEKTADDDLSEDDQAKLAGADFLGRTMAHSFYAELSEIGKEAGVAAAVGGATVGRLAKMKAYLKVLVAKAGRRGTGLADKTGKHLKKYKGRYMAGAGGTALGLGAGYMAGKKKKASDDIVLARANEILAAADEVCKSLEKQSSDEEALNEQALELLAQNEYDVEKIVSLLADEE